MDGAEMLDTGRRQLRQVFQFLEQWHIHQVDVPRDWRRHAWTLSLGDLPAHPFVEVGRVEGETDDGFVLRVRRPDETPCPAPPAELLPWLLPGWREPDRKAEVVATKNELIDGDTLIVRFDESEERTRQFTTWNERREKWKEAEIPVRQVVALFQRLFELRGRLERQSEQLQFALGQGMLSRGQLEESVHGITRRLSVDDPDRLEREASRLEEERNRLIAQLNDAEISLERAISDEYDAFVVAGQTYEPSQAARLVRELIQGNAWIPGDLEQSAPLPIGAHDIKELYQLNEEVAQNEEEEIDGDLPELSGLPDAIEFRRAVSREAELRRLDLRIKAVKS